MAGEREWSTGSPSTPKRVGLGEEAKFLSTRGARRGWAPLIIGCGGTYL
jgi:hypothetical protein